jgi:hypothetical protein
VHFHILIGDDCVVDEDSNAIAYNLISLKQRLPARQCQKESTQESHSTKAM